MPFVIDIGSPSPLADARLSLHLKVCFGVEANKSSASLVWCGVVLCLLLLRVLVTEVCNSNSNASGDKETNKERRPAAVSFSSRATVTLNSPNSIHRNS